MRFGFQISIQGGFKKVVPRALELGCKTIQIFSRNPRSWQAKPLDEEDCQLFKKNINQSGISPVFVHTPYLINLASGVRNIFIKSVSAICEDLKRTEKLGAKFLILHVGKAINTSRREAMIQIANALDECFKRVQNNVILLLENTAGQGHEIGFSFDEIGEIINLVQNKDRIRVCLDTAHAYAAGYDLKNKLDEVLKEFDRLIGLQKLVLLHLNDSRVPLGSRLDRHWHIGQGEIGFDGFKRLVNHELLKNLPGIMETPRKSVEDDKLNMQTVLSLVEY